MNSENKKIGIGLMLFIAWVLLVILKVQGAEDLILGIKAALIGLGAYHLNDRTNQPQEVKVPDPVLPAPQIPEVKPVAPEPTTATPAA